MNANDTSFITSISKAISKAKGTGSLEVVIPRLFKLYHDYIEWIVEQESIGFTKYTEKKKILQGRITAMKGIFPELICNYSNKITVAGCTDVLKPGTNVVGTENQTNNNNTAPTVSGVTINLLEEECYTFTYDDFTNAYADGQGDIPYKVIIYVGSTDGTFKFDGNTINSIFEFNINDVSKLTYCRDLNSDINTTFQFRVSDMNANSLYSTLTTNTITATSESTNLHIVGDNTITVDNNVTTVLTFDMFTIDTNPQYSDPEGDLLDAIRIDDINSTNQGTFYVRGTEIIVGQIITREEIQAGDFTHVGANINTIASDSFSFSGRDEGSGIWVN